MVDDICAQRDAQNDDRTPETPQTRLTADATAAQILERITDAFLALDAQWRVVYLNDKAAQALGRQRDDLIGKDLWAELPEGVGGPFYRAYAHAMATQVPAHFEEYAPTRARWFSNHLYPSPNGLTIFFTDITERKQAEEDLRQFQFIADHAADAFFLMDASGNFTYVNEAALQSLGYTAEQFRGLRVPDVDPLYQDEQYQALFERADGERLLPFETQHRRADGTTFPVEASVSRLDMGGRPLLFGSIRDISERKHSEKALRETNDWLRLALRGGGFASGNVDLATRQFLHVSETYKAHFGLPLDAEFSLDTLVQTIHPDDRVFVGAAFRQAIESHCDYETKYRVVWPDGSVHWISAQASPIYDEAGRPARMIGVVQEITKRKQAEDERKQAEEALRESEQRLRLALAGGKLGTWQLDVTSHEVVNISDQCKAHFGLSPEAHATATELLQAVHADDCEFLRQTVLRAIESGHDYAVEFRVVWPDGGVHWISTHGSLTFDEAGQAVSLIGVTQEITGRKELEAQKEHALWEAKERADRDALTGLLNHRAFYIRLEEETLRASREGTSLAVAVLDLDNFKFFNDVYGHTVGDHVLRTVAERLSAVCRPYDAVSRFGGDEFALLFGSIGSATHREIEARLRDNLSDLNFLPNDHAAAVPITLSVGVALFPDHSSERLEVVKLADERLLRSKTGRVTDSEAQDVRATTLSAVADFALLAALVTAVDNKDRYTRCHSEDVMTYSLMIAHKLGLSEEQRSTAAVAALLHDVGKIGVPDSVLRKPGPLTEEEFDAVKQHPQMGAIIVSAVPGLEATLDAVRHHHEHWDGGGYPLGLRGEETPLIARLLAVADAYSAMTADRPYRKGMERGKALSILAAGAGTQWDPQCVEAFLQALP